MTAPKRPRRDWLDPLHGKTLVWLTAVFLGSIVLANRIVRFLCLEVYGFNCPHNWPLSVFMFRAPPQSYYPNFSHLTVAAVTMAIFIAGLALLRRSRFHPALIMALATLFILGTNLAQGVQWGLITPVAGVGEFQFEYYNDAIKIRSPIAFLTNYTDIQAGLSIHSRTHPPGAVLLYYLLWRLFLRPEIIAIALTVLAVVLSAPAFLKLCTWEARQEAIARRMSLLLLLLPSVQIYFTATLDAIGMGLLLSALALFMAPRRGILTLFGSALVLWLALFLNFGSLFLVPVIFAFEIFEERSLWRAVGVLGLVILFFILLFLVTGFNPVESFLIASRLENPEGPRFIAEPVSYVATRIENIAELIVFFGPLLTVLALRGTRTPPASTRTRTLLYAATGTLLAMLLLGVFRTGESGRAAIFIYPFLLLPVLNELQARDPSQREWTRLFSFVFGQSLLMQMIGNFFW